MMARRDPHYLKGYDKARRLLLEVARSNPAAVCWRDGLTLNQHPSHRNGKQPTWTAGHTRASSTTWTVWLDVTRQPPDGDWLALEAAQCNFAAGARHGNKLRTNPQSRKWLSH